MECGILERRVFSYEQLRLSCTDTASARRHAGQRWRKIHTKLTHDNRIGFPSRGLERQRIADSSSAEPDGVELFHPSAVARGQDEERRAWNGLRLE
jgi:hypothetical protein